MNTSSARIAFAVLTAAGLFGAGPADAAPDLSLSCEYFEDGSGLCDDGTVVPADTFEWDCTTMGNQVCAADVALWMLETDEGR